MGMLCEIMWCIVCVTGASLVGRCHDIDAHVRRAAVAAVVNVLKSPAIDVSSMSALVNAVKERLRDIRVILTNCVTCTLVL